VLLTGLGGATGHGHAPSTTGLRLSSLRQTAIARGSEPSDRLPARLLRWRPRRRIAYLAWADRAWADRVRRSIVPLDTACTTARKGERPRQGQDRREGPYRLSKIHGRPSEKDTGLNGRRP